MGKGGVSGFFKSIWYMIVVSFVGEKWQIFEMFSRKRKLDLTTVTYRKGDVAVVTGAGRGIGFETVKLLLQSDLHVIMGCRKVEEGETAIERIRSSGITTGTAEVVSVDLMSLISVRKFAEDIINKNLPVNILINNAGVMFPPYLKSEDGNESQLQINYLSHFLLTFLLLPILHQNGTPTKCSRVVNVSSCAHYGGKIDFEDIQMEKFYSPQLCYMNTKLMQVISAEDLNNRYTAAKVNVRVYSLHPGVVHTDLYKNMFISKFSCCLRCFMLNSQQGAQTQTYVALSPDVEKEGGQFYANLRKVKPKAKVYDPEIQKKLFEVSCKLLGIIDYTLPSSVSSIDNFPTDTTERPFVVKVKSNLT